jgi:hypothetical protein
MILRMTVEDRRNAGRSRESPRSATAFEPEAIIVVRPSSIAATKRGSCVSRFTLYSPGLWNIRVRCIRTRGRLS